MDKDTTYKRLLEEAQNNPNIIGFILGGGRGKGIQTENSDYDVMIIVPDDREKEYQDKYREYTDTSDVYVKVFSFSNFKTYADWDTEFSWDRYNFAHLKAQVDRNGEIQKLIDEKGIIPKDKIQDIVSSNLDAYINSYYRSIKNNRDKNEIASHFDAAESVPLLLTAIFALEGRIKPYNKYLGWELEKYPLVKLPWENEEFLKILEKIITTGEIETQKDVFEKIKKLFSENGYKDIIESWNNYYLG